jgi:hypothetical protein
VKRQHLVAFCFALLARRLSQDQWMNNSKLLRASLIGLAMFVTAMRFSGYKVKDLIHGNLQRTARTLPRRRVAGRNRRSRAITAASSFLQFSPTFRGGSAQPIMSWQFPWRYLRPLGAAAQRSLAHFSCNFSAVFPQS